MRVLIVEDQPDIGWVMTKIVGYAGHQATLAEDGCSAISMASKLPPDLVLLDINLPDIDGYETARRLRNQYGHQFPIYAVTATTIDLELAEKCGFDGIFLKPFTMKTLTTLLADFPESPC